MFDLRKLLTLFVMLVMLGIVGCQAQGHRTITLSFELKDQIEENTDGVDVYKAGFDPDSNIVVRLLDWLTGPVKVDETSDGDG